MTEFKCGNCKEVHILSPRARFCPNCGSSSLNLVIKELKEPAQRETLGVYSPPEAQTATTRATVPDLSLRATTEDSSTAVADQKEEEDQPRRRKR